MSLGSVCALVRKRRYIRAGVVPVRFGEEVYVMVTTVITENRKKTMHYADYEIHKIVQAHGAGPYKIIGDKGSGPSKMLLLDTPRGEIEVPIKFIVKENL